jgi:hypothetical protein
MAARFNNNNTVERQTLINRSTAGGRKYTPWRVFGLVGVVLGLTALTLALVSFIRSDNLVSWIKVHNKHHSSTQTTTAPLEAGCSLCGEVNATTYDQAVFEDGNWRARNKCRRVSNVQYFGSGAEHVFVPGNTTRSLTSDLYCDTLVVATSGRIITNGFRIIVRHRLVLNGTIDNSGSLYNSYEDSTLGTRYPPSYPPPPVPTNTLNTGSTIFFGVYYRATVTGFSTNWVASVCNVGVTGVTFGDPSTTSPSFLVGSIDSALKARDANGNLITAGGSGCPITYVDRNVSSNYVTQRYSPGGVGGGIVVISAHTMEFGPDAQVLAGGSAPLMTYNVTSSLVHNASALLGTQCSADSAAYWLTQTPGSSGGAGFVVFVTAQPINRTEVLRVTRTSIAPMITSIPPLGFRCNTSGYIDAVAPLNIGASYPPRMSGTIFVHDVCNDRPEVLYDNVDNDLNEITDRTDVDADGLWSCKPGETHINEADSSLTCDCDDQNPLKGDILNDVMYCGTCGTACPPDMLCRRGKCLPFCSAVNVVSQWANVTTGSFNPFLQSTIISWSTLNTTGVHAILRISITSDNNNVTSAGVPTILLNLRPLDNPSTVAQNASANISNTIRHNCGNSSVFVNVTRTNASAPFEINLEPGFNVPFNGMTCLVYADVTFTADPTTRSPPTYLENLRLAVLYEYELYSAAPVECATSLSTMAFPQLTRSTPSLATQIVDWTV